MSGLGPIPAGTNASQVREAVGLVGIGNAFPVAPVLNDEFYRSDLKRRFFYDGNRWLSCDLFTQDFAVNGAASSATMYIALPLDLASKFFFETITWSANPSTGADWSLQLIVRTAANATTTVATVDGAAWAAATWNAGQQAVDYVFDIATHKAANLSFIEVADGATMTGALQLSYRLVG